MYRIIKEAFSLIDTALALDEVPVAAVVFNPETYEIISSAHNMTYSNCDATSHAEIEAIRKACKKLNAHRLDNLAIYVTLEPCTMCAGAISHANLSALFFGAYDKKGGAVENGIQFFNHPSSMIKIKITGGIEEKKSSQILKDFFKSKRKKKAR